MRRGGRVRAALRGGLGLGLALAVAACQPDDQETRSLDPQGEQTRARLAPEVVAVLDSGTVAFRDHRFEDALAHYRSATELDADHPAGWFGISISERALGNVEAAESAMARVRDLAPGATILHPDDTTAALDTMDGGGETRP